MGTSRYRNCQWVSRSALKYVTGDALVYLLRQCVPKWDSPNSENVLGMAGTTSLLKELTSMAVQPFVGWRGEVDSIGNSRRPWVKIPERFVLLSHRYFQCLHTSPVNYYFLARFQFMYYCGHHTYTRLVCFKIWVLYKIYPSDQLAFLVHIGKQFPLFNFS